MSGIALALSIILAWLSLHVFAVFFYALHGAALAAAPLLVALICWLNVGLFIIAHDAIHGSLAPGHRRVNLAFGRIALALYAGFRFSRLEAAHLAHHRAPGTPGDPDFDSDHPRRFWRWYASFMRRYFGWTEFAILCVPVAIYLLLGAKIPNLLLFWALPAALSSLQLFYFGTFLPHRHDEAGFADRHNARSTDFGGFISLLTCFHFGYHHEHHHAPHVPWWRLPAYRRAQASVRSSRPLESRRPRS